MSVEARGPSARKRLEIAAGLAADRPAATVQARGIRAVAIRQTTSRASARSACGEREKRGPLGPRGPLAQAAALPPTAARASVCGKTA
eukprot:836735-Pyramimonas_sp.AAC.1